MTGTQSAIMWLGILIIIARLFTTSQGEQLWSMVTTGGNAGGNTAKGGSGSAKKTTAPANWCADGINCDDFMEPLTVPCIAAQKACGLF